MAQKKKKNSWRDIKIKYRLMITNETHLNEVVSIRLSKLKLLLLAVFSFLFFFLLMSLLILFTPVKAEEAIMQTDLNIKDVFQIYGKNKNVVMVELSKEMIDMYDVTFYKSITIKNDPGALTYIRNCLKNDQDRARKIKEVTNNGEIVSAYYQILEENNKINRFILFNVNPRNEITLIYIEGELDSDDLITILFTTKN